MAVSKGFGDMIRDARLSQGLTYGTVSRKLRIRPDILEAIENQDFSKIPPSSYGRGMVNAYARLLHLNSNKVMESYLNEEKQNANQGSSRSMNRSHRNRATGQSDQVDFEHHGYGSYDEDFTGAEHDARARLEQRRARSGRGSAPSRAQRSFNEAALSTAGNLVSGAANVIGNAAHSITGHRKDVDINHSIYADRNKGSLIDGSRRRAGGSSHSQHAVLSGGNYVGTFDNASPQGGSKLPLIFLVAVIVLVLIFGVRYIVSCSSDQASSTSASTSSSMNISGLTDPGSAGTVEQEVKVIAIAPTAAVFYYEVPADSSAYVEIYIDGSGTPTVAKTVDGPARWTYDVTGTLKFVTTSPGSVTVKLDGNKVDLTDDNGDGIYIYEVNFEDILSKWKQENNQ